MSLPTVSVVMSVYNGAGRLRATMDSVLDQQGVDIEFIIVNDGSTDGAAEILKECAETDARVTILDRPHRGLTAALIEGCAHARGRYIARQDVGDLSQPGRLESQARVLDNDSESVLVSCVTRFVGPEGEILSDTPIPENPTADLLTLQRAQLRGPHHGCTMFRRDVYDAVGGYRQPFEVAQDLDLWVRLAEKGRHSVVPCPFYQALIAPDSISATRRRDQERATRVILQCARLRREGRSQDVGLRRLQFRKSLGRAPARWHRAATAYFIARCLDSSDPVKADRYYRQAIVQWPVHLKAWWFILKPAKSFVD